MLTRRVCPFREEEEVVSSRPARIQEVADAANVSTSTVSNFLNRPERVSPDTAARIQEAIRKLDFMPHPAAAGLRNGRVSLIGMVVPDVTNSFYASIVRGAGDIALEHGFSVVLCNSGDDPVREQTYFSMLAQQRAAGVVVVALGADSDRLDRLRHRGIPLVLADRTTPSTFGCSVGVDDVTGGRLAVQHLLASGARNIAVVNGDWSIRQCVDRMKGAMEAASNCSGATLRQLVVKEMTVEAGVEAGLRLGEHQPDAVFCINDFLAVGICRSLTSHGIRVPEDVPVVGYGDLDVASFATVPLTTVRQPVIELGRAAVSLLLDDVESDKHEHRTQIFTPEIQRRDSAP